MNERTVLIGKKTREASEGLVTLGAPGACGCGHESSEILLDLSAHATAFCAKCRRYLRHLKAGEFQAKPVARTYSPREDRIEPFLGIFLVRVPDGAGHREAVAGVFTTLGDRDVRRAAYLAAGSDVKCCYPHDSLVKREALGAA